MLLDAFALVQSCFSKRLLKYHCFNHQKACCGETLALKSVMDVVIKCANKIRASALNRRKFRQFLSDVKADYGELPLHCEVMHMAI